MRFSVTFTCAMLFAGCGGVVGNGEGPTSSEAVSSGSSCGQSAPFTSGAKVSFTFDDSVQSAYTLAAPVLAKYGYPGVDYAITDCLGMTPMPNGCDANNDRDYL